MKTLWSKEKLLILSKSRLQLMRQNGFIGWNELSYIGDIVVKKH